ncbi:sensor histidine kinase [Pseudochryseolinea flava]|uniref:histidine kinase n=2 Tax=Pseudochryseolinea flava TaxID=2059302 RepID=A0A364Y6X9_9BACT|nr:sensor histidine kinase [Pseudochryseolinea flava]
MDHRALKVYLFHRPNRRTQYFVSIGTIVLFLGIGFLVQDYVGYRVIALVLMLAVSVLAIFLDIVPVLLAASLSALLWNFLFIPPRFTLAVGDAEDRLLFVMYFVIALINGVATYKIREMQKVIRRKEARADAVKFYNTLFNSLSHELRTPITTIVGAADNLQAANTQLTEKDKQELIGEISIAGLRLNQQVENLLSMSRLESGFLQLKKDWCDVHDLVYKTIGQLEIPLQYFKVAVFIPETLPLVKLDFGIMEHVLFNLISNAANHTPVDSKITIQAAVENDQLVMIVADNGPGFPQDEMDKVFDKFYRLKDAKPGGTGLGLSIARGFVEAHGGTITLENLPVCGAKFTIHIPTELSYLSGLKNE